MTTEKRILILVLVIAALAVLLSVRRLLLKRNRFLTNAIDLLLGLVTGSVVATFIPHGPAGKMFASVLVGAGVVYILWVAIVRRRKQA